MEKDYRQGIIRFLRHHYHTLHTRGDGLLAVQETLILCGVAEMFRENGVVFLGKVRWISFRLGGDGGTPCEFNMCFVRGFAWEFVHFGNPHIF